MKHIAYTCLVAFSLLLVCVLLIPPRRANSAASLLASSGGKQEQMQATTTTVQPTSRMDQAWRTWDQLPTELRRKVDPRIIAEFRGDVLPAYLATQIDAAALAPLVLQPRQQTRFLVYLQQQPDLAAFAQQSFASQVDRRDALFDWLRSSAQETQSGVRSLIEAHAATDPIIGYQPFFIVNALAVEGDLSMVIDLARRRDVARIVANYPLQLFQQEPTAPATTDNLTPAGLAPENWNIELVGANRVWLELGVRGEGAVVAGFDTGVSWQHPALINQYRGSLPNGQVDHNYNWFEPDANLYPNGNLGPSLSTQPRDCSGHGTHTMGTMLGDGGEFGRQVGMAPGARWIALPGICSGTMPGGIRDDIGALKAFQWVLCPTDLSGDLGTANCSLAPDVVNNSWGSANPVNDILRPAVQKLRAAGVAPVFASGNPSAGPGSIGTPANAPEAITVGATDRYDELTYFSGRGPSFYEGEQKPELTAPGMDVLSTIGSNEYYKASGTSMAAPHVAGLIALMVSADLKDGVRDFSIDEIERFMEFSALDLGKPGPDDDYGYGRIRALEAVQWALTAGDLRGVVRDAATNLPVRGAAMWGGGFGDQRFVTLTDDNGIYSATVPAGAYQVTIKAFEYISATFGDQQVFANSLSLADFRLQRRPSANLSGVVRSSGAAVGDALISVQGQPNRQTRSANNGAYSLTLPVGLHTLVVEAQGQRRLHETVTVSAAGSTHDFSLQAAPSLLLVEADAFNGWFFSWPIANIYRWALEKHDYSFDLWRIQYTNFTDTQTMEDGSLGYGIPSTATLQAYDVVIWAHNGCLFSFSCDYEQTDGNLAGYLANGGHLILSGQDYGLVDGNEFYDEYLHADLLESWAGSTGNALFGIDFLQGIQVTLTNASLYGYRNGAIDYSPDAVGPTQEDGSAYPILNYENHTGAAALAVDPCAADYRAVYLAMGYENIGPRAANRDPAIAEVLARSIEWLVAPQSEGGLILYVAPTELISIPGEPVHYPLQVTNRGSAAVQAVVTAVGNQWPTSIRPQTQPITVQPCQTVVLDVEVTPPANTPNGGQDVATITIANGQSSAAGQSVVLTTTAFLPWQVEAPMPTARARLGVAALPGSTDLYALGGWTLGEYFTISSSANERYNTCTQRWESLSPIPYDVANAGVAALDGKIFVVGGHYFNLDSGYGTYDRVSAYEPDGNRWVQVTSLPMPYAGLAVAVAQGKLYAFGGVDDNGFASDQTLEYDPVSDSWQVRAAMPSGMRAYGAAATLNGKIYVAGGYPYLKKVEVYDPATDRWSNVASLVHGRYALALAVSPSGLLYAIGGDSPGAFGGVEQYNPQTNVWQVISAPRDPNRIGVGSVYAAGRIYAVGGANAYLTESLRVDDSFCLSHVSPQESAIFPGVPITYTVELVANPENPTSAFYVSAIPKTLRFVGFPDDPLGATYDAATGQVQWQGMLPANSPPRQFSYLLELAATELLPGATITSTAHFSTSAGLVFSRTNHSTLLSVDFSASQLTVTPPKVKSGDVMTYTVNLRGRTATGGPVGVVAPLPTDVEYQTGSLTYGLGIGRYLPDTRQVIWQGVVPAAKIEGDGSNYVWGDSDGKGRLGQVEFDWIDIRATGTLVQGYDDAYECRLPIGFAFRFYGQSYDTFCMSTNGFLSFDQIGYPDLSNDCPLPNPEGTDALIAAIWDDLIVVGGLYYQQMGNAPNRRLVAQWSGVRRYGANTTDYADFQVILFENGEIQVQVLNDGLLTGNSSTTGLEDASGAMGVTYACNQSRTLHSHLAVRFAPETLSATATSLSFAVRNNPIPKVNQSLIATAIISTPQEVMTRSVSALINPLDISGSKVTLSRREVTLDDEVVYEFVLRNDGLVAAFPVLSMSVPTATTYLADLAVCPAGQCSYSNGYAQWVGELAAGQTLNIRFALRLTARLPDRTPVISHVTLEDGYGNHYELPMQFEARRADLSGSFGQITPEFIDPGEGATIRLFARNSGVKATDGKMEFALPAGLLYEEGSLVCSAGDCKLEDGVVYWAGRVEARGVIQVQLRVRTSTTANYGDRFTGELRVEEVGWPERYTHTTFLRVAHSLYLPNIFFEVVLPPVYLPLVFIDPPTSVEVEPIEDFSFALAPK
jgi:subtilisin family serine protease